ncbi:MAG: maleylpyruvate isomerase family mycothiol-dependent enzyme [Microthrixaceae bacterium]
MTAETTPADTPYAVLIDALAAEGSRMAATLAHEGPAALNRPVPTCPGWTIADLVAHVGSVHRRACHVVETRAQRGRAFVELVVDPPRPESLARWVGDGADTLRDALRDATPDESLWTWGDGRNARWWARRQHAETLVHRLDLELALGSTPEADPALAAEAVDEGLSNVAASGRFHDRVAELRGEGSLHLHATDTAGEWTITLRDDGFDIGHDHTKGTVAARGPAIALLGALTGRGPVEALDRFGQTALLEWWIERSGL